MSEVKVEAGRAEGGRRGGREARRAQRAAPLPSNQRPVRPGLEGGRYRPLNDEDVLRIHHAALDVLEQIGLADAIPSCIEVCTAAGAILNENGRLLFPRALVEDTLAKAARRFPLHGQDPQHDLEPWGKRVYFGTAGAAVNIVDPVSGAYRESTVKDAYDIARIVDQMEHIHFYQRSVVCRDIADPADMDFNTCYASVMGTTKHVGTSWVAPEQCVASLEMLHMVAGGEEKWRARPFVSQSNCFVVPPLKFATDACRCLEIAVRGGMPVLLLSAGQAGATAPASLAGAMSGGSPEQALLSSACGQMAHFYDLTGGTSSGMSDSKIPDAQAGMEKAYNHALVGNAGANLIYESAGMHASLLGFCLESLVIDNDIIGAVQRTIKGIEVTDESISVETIRDVCLNGPGHYLGSDQTLKLMQTEYVYPAVGDRRSPNDWAERGATDIVDRAMQKIREILERHHPRHVSREVDAAIRARFKVLLPREAMQAA